VLGKTAARHTSQEFVEFLTEVIERALAWEVHIILDNLSAHKSQVVRDFMATHLNVHFHFTPTYSSWLNQVEIWFSKVERDVIARGIFTRVRDLARKLRRYINAYSANAKPIQWNIPIRHAASAVTLSQRHATGMTNRDVCSPGLPRRRFVRGDYSGQFPQIEVLDVIWI
jgi:transposase